MLETKDDRRLAEEVGSVFGPNRGPESTEPRAVGGRRSRRTRDLNRSLSQRVSRGHVFGLLLGLVGFATTWVLIGDDTRTVEVYFADTALAGGREVDRTAIRSVEVDADSPLAALGLQAGDAAEEWYTTGSVAAGDPLLATDVASGPTEDGLVEVALNSEFSVGDLRIGDRVGVVVVVAQSSLASASWLAVDARVTAVGPADTGTGLIAASAQSLVTVAVTPRQALALAAGSEAGSLAIVSTGLDAESIETDERIVVSIDEVGRPVTGGSEGVDDG